MGVVAKQSSINLVVLVLGFFLGALNVIFLYPIILSKEEFGLTRILISVAILASSIGAFGSPSILIKYLPFYKESLSQKRKILLFTLKIAVYGTVFVNGILYFMKSWVFEQYESHAVLFGNYYYLLYYLVPLLVFGYVLSSYFKGLYRTVLPNVLNDIGLRIAQTLMLGLFYFEWIDFKQFMYLFVLSYFVINLIMVVYLLFIKELNFGKSEEIVKLNKPIEMVKYGGVNFLSGLASGLTNKIDVLMLSSMVVCVVCTGNEGLEAVAVYSWALNISAFIEMPARAVAGIGLALIGQAWKENNLNDISSLYKSSSLTQLIIGLLIFACIWINVDLLFIIKPEYSEAKWAILFLGIGKLLDAASGLNYHIIATSKYYFILTGFLIFLGVSTYFTNLIFIPKFGVMGAAIATGLTLVLYNVIAFVFLLSKYKMQPFSMQTFYVLALGMGIYGIIQLLIDFENVILTSIVQTVLFSLLYIGAILYFKVSTDISNLVHKLLKFKMNRAN